jgi:hypothetical protein
MKTITGNEMRDRLLEKLEMNATYGKVSWAKVKYRPTPIKFERCEDNYGWMTEVDPQQYTAMHEWCQQNFTHGDWYSGIYYVWVKDEKMVTWFTLRWL